MAFVTVGCTFKVTAKKTTKRVRNILINCPNLMKNKYVKKQPIAKKLKAKSTRF